MAEQLPKARKNPPLYPESLGPRKLLPAKLPTNKVLSIFCMHAYMIKNPPPLQSLDGRKNRKPKKRDELRSFLVTKGETLPFPSSIPLQPTLLQSINLILIRFNFDILFVLFLLISKR